MSQSLTTNVCLPQYSMAHHLDWRGSFHLDRMGMCPIQTLFNFWAESLQTFCIQRSSRRGKAERPKRTFTNPQWHRLTQWLLPLV